MPTVKQAPESPLALQIVVIIIRMRAGYRAPTTAFLSQSNMLRSSPPERTGAPKRAWVPGGSCKAATSTAASVGPAGRALSVRPDTAGTALAGRCSRSLSFQPGGGVGGGRGREALRESVLGQAALAERRRRLQELYAELQQA